MGLAGRAHRVRQAVGEGARLLMAARAARRLIAARAACRKNRKPPQLDLLPRHAGCRSRNVRRAGNPRGRASAVGRFGRNRRGGEENADHSGEDEVTNGHRQKVCAPRSTRSVATGDREVRSDPGDPRSRKIPDPHPWLDQVLGLADRRFSRRGRRRRGGSPGRGWSGRAGRRAARARRRSRGSGCGRRRAEAGLEIAGFHHRRRSALRAVGSRWASRPPPVRRRESRRCSRYAGSAPSSRDVRPPRMRAYQSSDGKMRRSAARISGK